MWFSPLLGRCPLELMKESQKIMKNCLANYMNATAKLVGNDMLKYASVSGWLTMACVSKIGW